MDEYLKVSAVFHLSGSGDYSGSTSRTGRVQRQRSHEFENIFKTACDELKQKSGTHTKTGVVALG